MSKWFTKIYDSFMRPFEKNQLEYIRERLLNEQQGIILEVGSGTGINFPYYQRAERVTAVEPDDSMRKKSQIKLSEAQVPIELVDASGESLPFPDNTFDVAVATLVLCTIPDPDRALQEIARVCKPGARLVFLEHVKLENPLLSRLQDWLTPLWKQVCGGCHLNRNTQELIKQNGFYVQQVEKYYKGLFLAIEAKNVR
ncbi:class I SAM-dependent methyltransferase [Bacillus piscicola]|uniref:class I SAM-dependent methyltransferase n=1 Tax=Bacillus piscicola TaxID=1632684 RepID=UPI001F08B8DA|nr:class I SAM-dependent methyltransferase [Bacillus piscicola]